MGGLATADPLDVQCLSGGEDDQGAAAEDQGAEHGGDDRVEVGAGEIRRALFAQPSQFLLGQVRRQRNVAILDDDVLALLG